jgi:uracil-DNA glycosylase family 4
MPFVGKAGGRLDEALSVRGLDRSTVYITNAALCRAAAPPPTVMKKSCH